MTKAIHRIITTLALIALTQAALWAQSGITKYVRYSQGGNTSYGILDGQTVRELDGDFLYGGSPTGKTVPLSSVRLEIPLDPIKISKVLGVALNTDMPGGPPLHVRHPRFFAKMPTSLNRHEGGVELPPEAMNLNFEGELVIIIGKKGRHISVDDAEDHIFGYSVGNDFSENTWYKELAQLKEPTRLISKGTDTWACLGPVIAKGVDWRDLDIEVRLNGETVAKGTSKYMRNDVRELVSYISRYMTLLPGDAIYVGTVAPPVLPGKRHEMQVGDVLEVEIEDIGLLRNKIIPMDVP
jgi:2-keto-4-pentenoate hydratase/2-oxohepta-3-ene-1,7-dioic acid hydratase in catechol pathway